ncbi:hypothetical protein OPV22_003467 [Ensete ventricosum]|uniref:Pectinesterase catalytic domain-containing protein n=1 Tax=Ensete ventricosum TaxID=4639 RepID=A0AAV8S0N2_ENSVE|nr:hypothetical protein OPV22_003467 [Ensete ventricosum]
MGIGRTPPRCHQSERPPGTGTLPDVMIYKEGGCQFGAVQAAVEAAPEHSAGRYVIYIKEGVYEEMVRVPFMKRNLSNPDLAMVRDLTFANTARPDKHQAIAFRSQIEWPISLTHVENDERTYQIG